MTNGLSRRAVFSAASAAGAAALATGAGPASAASAARTLDLSDPKVRAMTRAKIIGSIAAETVYKFYRLHIYGYMNDGKLVPFFTLNNLNITDWTPMPDGTYRSMTAESAAYCKFGTDEPLDTWTNPITGATRKVWHFLGGPFSTDVGPDAMKVVGADLAPESPLMEVLADMVFIPTAASASWANPMKPSEWPTQSAGMTAYWESHSVMASRVADVLDPRITAAPAFGQFQNMATFHPWMGMGARAGRTWGKAHGAKFKALNQIPAAALKSLELKTPEVFDYKSWTGPKLDIPSWMAVNKPS